MEGLSMEAIQAETKATEYTKTITDSCPTCISGTDPIIIESGAGILFEDE
jgi:hypothetical protein